MYKVDTENNELQQLEEVKFFEIGIKERSDIQEWLRKSPQVFGVEDNSLLILCKELPVSGKDDRGIRLDLLALDRFGKLVVIELKRDDARGDIDWQAIKYAARCSKFSPEDIVRLLSKYENCTEEEAKNKIVEHIEAEIIEGIDVNLEKLLSFTHSGLDMRIILVAREFHPDVCAAVAWLRDNEIDISCIKLKPFRNNISGELYLTSERILPLTEMSDLIDHKRSVSQNKISITQENGRVMYSNTASELGDDELKNCLRVTLQRKDSNLTPRLIKFLKILSDGNEHEREKLLVDLNKASVGLEGDIGQTGRLLSNISAFITKPNSGHLRQLIEFTGEDNIFQSGKKKTRYKIKDNYVELLKNVLAEFDSSSHE